MARVREEVVLDAAPNDVWPFVVEPEKIKRWRKDITAFVVPDKSPPKLGQRFYIEKKVGGKTRRFDSRITTLENGRKLAFEAEAAGFAKVKAVYEIIPEGKRCRFVIDETVTMLRGGFLMTIIDRLIIQRGLSKILRGFLADLKTIVTV